MMYCTEVEHRIVLAAGYDLPEILPFSIQRVKCGLRHHNRRLESVDCREGRRVRSEATEVRPQLYCTLVAHHSFDKSTKRT